MIPTRQLTEIISRRGGEGKKWLLEIVPGWGGGAETARPLQWSSCAQAPRSLCGLQGLVGIGGEGGGREKRERKRNRWSFTPGQALREQGLEFRAVCGPGALSSRELLDPGRWVRGKPRVSRGRGRSAGGRELSARSSEICLRCVCRCQLPYPKSKWCL